MVLLSGESGRVKFSRVQIYVGIGWAKGSVKAVISGVEMTCKLTRKLVASRERPETRKCHGGGLRSVVKVPSSWGVLMTRVADASWPITRWTRVFSFDHVASASGSNLALQGLIQAFGPGLLVQAVRRESSRPLVTWSQSWGVGKPFGGRGVISVAGAAICARGVGSIGVTEGVAVGKGGGGAAGWGGDIIGGDVMWEGAVVPCVALRSWSIVGSWERFGGRVVPERVGVRGRLFSLLSVVM